MCEVDLDFDYESSPWHLWGIKFHLFLLDVYVSHTILSLDRASNTVLQQPAVDMAKGPHFNFENSALVISLRSLGVKGFAKQMCRDGSKGDSSHTYINQ